MVATSNRAMPWWSFALFIGLGLAFVAIGALTAAAAQRFIRAAQTAEGRIVDYSETRDLDDGQAMYSPVFEFSSADGQVHRISANSSSSSKPAIGQAVTVLYDPDNPERARLKSWVALWMLPTISLGLGLVLFAVGLALALLLRPRRAGAAT